MQEEDEPVVLMKKILLHGSRSLQIQSLWQEENSPQQVLLECQDRYYEHHFENICELTLQE